MPEDFTIDTEATWQNAARRAAAWFMTDPPATFPEAPNLSRKSNPAGDFDEIHDYRLRQPPRAGRHLYVYRDYRQQQTITVAALGGRYRRTHIFVAHILWHFDARTRTLAEAENRIEGAIDAVVTRIVGPPGDKTHAGVTLGALGFDDADSETKIEYLLDPYDAFTRKQPVEVLIQFTADEDFYQ